MKKHFNISPNIFERIRKFKTKSSTPFITTRNPHSFTKYNSFQKSHLSIHKTHSQIIPYLNEMNIIHYNITKHNSNINTHNNHIIKWIMFDDKRKIVSTFKNYLLWDETAEFLRRYYLCKESIERLPKIANYYETFTIFSPNYFGFNYEQVKLMIKWVKKKRQLLDETINDEHQMNYNLRNANNNDVIIPREEIESIKNETPIKKDRTNNEFLSELSKSRFKEIKNENNANQSICSLMKDISSIHSFGHYEEQTQKINKNIKPKKQIDLKGTSTTNKLSKRTIHLIQSHPLSKTKIIITNKALINNNNNFAKFNINSHRASVLAIPTTYALITDTQPSKQVKKFPMLKEQLTRKTGIFKKTSIMKKRLILKQNEITPELQITTNVKHSNNLHNNLRSNSVTKENKSMTKHFRNTNYTNNNNNIYLNTQPEEVKYPYLITERSRSKTKGMSESSKDILLKTQHKKIKKVPYIQLHPKKQRINNEQEMIRKVLLQKKLLMFIKA